MIQYLLGKSDFSALFSLVSKDFLKVVPLPSTLALIGRLTSNSQNPEKWEQTKTELQTRLEVLIENAPAEALNLPPLSHEEGQEVLKLYFLQILTSDTWILDFRRQSFQTAPFRWVPSPYFLNTTHEYAESIRNLYAGFYDEDEDRFTHSLQVLNLTPARKALEEHFGIHSQSAIRFELQKFQSTFANIFRLCAEAESRLHPEFAVLGILLLTLYENLEPSGEAFDVRGAYREASAQARKLRETST